MNTVKRWLAALLSTAMVFTSAGLSSVGTIAVAAATTVAIVTTDDTTEPIPYESLNAAITATNDVANAKKHAKIELQADAELTGADDVSIIVPMEINLNSHKLTETAKLKESYNESGEKTICRGETYEDGVLTKVTFAKHEPNFVYNWKQNSDGSWEVVSVSEKCAANNCSVKVWEDKDSSTDYIGTTALVGEYYVYTHGTTPIPGANTSEEVKKAANIEVKGYTLKTKAYIVTVNNTYQHKDGLPVVKAVVTKNDNNVDVDANVEVTAATSKEITDAIAAANIFEGDSKGTAITSGNTAATCTSKGAVVYKVVVTDPDGKIQQETYLRDKDAIPELEHVQGAFKGYKILVKNATAYASETKAKEGAKALNKTYVESTVDEDGKYYFWYYDAAVTYELNQSKAGALTGKTVHIPEEAIHDDGSFTYVPIYYCDYTVSNTNCTGEVVGEAVSVKPYDNAQKSTELDGKHSTCTEWVYPGIKVTYEFSNTENAVAKTKFTFTATAENNIPKPKAEHISDGTKFEVNTQPTCSAEGEASVVCSVCSNSDVTVSIPKLAHAYVAFPGTTVPKANEIDSALEPSRIVTLNADRTEATIEPTCELAGGVYKYCDGTNNKDADGAKIAHWVKQSTIKETGHDLSTKVSGWVWSDGSVEGTGNVEADYDPSKDYTFTVTRQCKNPGCSTGKQVTYHTKSGETTESDVYGGIKVVDQAKGVDCQTVPKTVYTVIGLTDTLDREITIEHAKYNNDLETAIAAGAQGPHKYAVKTWNWSKDFETATVTAECTNKGCNHKSDAESAKVTQETSKDGITTFTATYGEETDVKKVYTLKNAKVTYDTSTITDGNLINGVGTTTTTSGTTSVSNSSAAPQVPEVVVTINGTVIDSDLYKASWSYNNTSKVVQVTVDWNNDIKGNEDVEVVSATAQSAEFKVASNKTFANVTYDVTENGEDVNYTERFYSPDLSNVIVAVPQNNDGATIKGATIKYAVTDKPVTAKASELKADPWAEQRKIEALEFNLDNIEDIKNAGTSYIYVQVNKEGYTTYTKLLTTFTIKKPAVTVYVDNATIIEGDKPNLHIRAVDDDGEVAIDPADFTITTVGGESIENLKAGSYRLRVTADNYAISTSEAQYVAVLTVLAKDGSTDIEQAEAEAVAAQINALSDTSSADDVAATRAAYDKLTDAQKARINAETVKKLTDAEDKITADKIVDQLNKATTDADKAAAYEAYSKLSDAQKKLVDAKAADAVAAAKTAKDAADKAAAEEAAKKEAAAKEEATKTATSVKSAAAKVASTNPKYSAVQSAVKALDKVLADKNATSAQIKAATDKVNAAVTASKTAGAKKGATYTVGGQKYKATSTKAVTLTKAKNAKSVTVPATVKINGKKIAVTKIGAKAFAKSKATKVTIKTKKLTKKGVKNSLKGSKVKTVKVGCGKAYVKKYKKFFTKANAGKKVTVK